MVLPEAKLYTKFVKAKSEYRVHVVGGAVVACHRKVQKEGSDKGSEIKNSENDWEFKRVTIYNQDIPDQALKAVEAVGLDFAAVDVLWDGEKAWVLEANTAPGVFEMPLTLSKYCEALKKLLNTP